MKDTIIIHCSATRAGQDITAADIDCWHRARGFWSIGYHYVIRLCLLYTSDAADEL